MHHQRVATFYSQVAEQRRARQLKFAALFDRFFAAKIYQVRQLDILRVLGATNVDNAAYKLFARRTFDFQIKIGGSAEVFRKRNSDFVAVNIEQETRQRQSFEQGAAGNADATATHGPGQRINLGLIRCKPHQRFQIGDGPTVITEQQRDGTTTYRSSAVEARHFITSRDADSNIC